MRILRFASAFLLAGGIALLFGLALLWTSPLPSSGPPAAEAAGSAADAFSIDMDPANTPANTATSLGSRETCASVIENDTLDADEDAVDGLQIQVTATNIPTSNPMIGFAFELLYPTDLNVTAKNIGFLLGANAGSSLLDASDGVPDADGMFNAAAADISVSVPESGTGVLQDLTLSTVPTAGTGVFPLSLQNAAHVDPDNQPFAPDALEGAEVAINRTCPLPPVDIELVALSLSSVNPAEPAGTSFSLTVQATANNNGPNPADIRFDLGVAGPGDCTLAPPVNQTEDFLNVLATESRTSTQIWTASCSLPSAHIFSASGAVTVIGLAEETTPGNNGPLTSGATVGITGDADVKVTGVTVDAPPDAATGAPFNVTVTANLHNNGLLDPVTVDTTLDLVMPAGCVRSPDLPQAINGTSLTLSNAVPVQAAWTVSCSTTGLKIFDGSASTGIDQLHTTDPNPGNNSGQGQDSTDTSLGVADVKVTSVTVTSPPSAAVNTNFPVIVSTVVHNNGPFFPVNTDVTLTLNLPADCFTPVTSIAFQNATLGPSIAAQLPDITFYVTCINHSFHNITATADIVIDDPLAGDPNPGNNTLTSTAATTAIIRTVDFKVVSVVQGTPPTANTSVPFNVTVDATLHNNGPDAGPANVSVSLALPADCTTPVNPILTNISLDPSIATALPTQTFPVTCAGESFHDFEASVSLAGPLHVVDTSVVNDSLSSSVTTVPVVGLADVKVTGVVVSAPTQANAGIAFNVFATATVHNNGPFGPINADAAVTLNMPADCSTTDTNPQAADNLALPTSTSLQVLLTWAVTCTVQSSHSFTSNASATPDQLHIEDPDAGNNAGSSAPLVVPVIAQADGKVTSAAVLNPPSFIASNTSVPLTVRTVLHNNGLFGPATFNLSRSITPPAGCTVTAPATSSHSLAVSVATTVDAVWTVNCVPGSYTFTFSHALAVNDLHVSDPTPGNNTAVAMVTVAVDTDGDGIPDDVEAACGSNPLNGASIPERIDGVYAGADDDLDVAIDEALPAGAAAFDCDRDGYAGSSESHVYFPSIQGDQDPCGTNVVPSTVPPTPIGWPADLQGGGIPDSTNTVNIQDFTSFLAPVRYFNTNVGTNTGDRRWDLVPGSGVFPVDINIVDLSNLLVVAPPMLGGTRAFSGPSCPFP